MADFLDNQGFLVGWFVGAFMGYLFKSLFSDHENNEGEIVEEEVIEEGEYLLSSLMSL